MSTAPHLSKPTPTNIMAPFMCLQAALCMRRAAVRQTVLCAVQWEDPLILSICDNPASSHFKVEAFRSSLTDQGYTMCLLTFVCGLLWIADLTLLYTLDNLLKCDSICTFLFHFRYKFVLHFTKNESL